MKSPPRLASALSSLFACTIGLGCSGVRHQATTAEVPTTVTVSPNPAFVVPSGTEQFVGLVSGASASQSTSLTWQVQESGAGPAGNSVRLNVCAGHLRWNRW